MAGDGQITNDLQRSYEMKTVELNLTVFLPIPHTPILEALSFVFIILHGFQPVFYILLSISSMKET